MYGGQMDIFEALSLDPRNFEPDGEPPFSGAELAAAGIETGHSVSDEMGEEL